MEESRSNFTQFISSSITPLISTVAGIIGILSAVYLVFIKENFDFEMLSVILTIILILLVIIIIFQIWKNSNKEDAILNEERNKAAVLRFVRMELSSQKKEPVEIDGFGFKVGSLREELESMAMKSKLPKVVCKLLVVSSKGEGVKFRAVLENSEPEYLKQNAAVALENIRRLAIILKNKNNSTLTARTFSFTPGFFILRINDKMVISFYLSKKGYMAPSITISRNKHEAVFSEFQAFFEKVYESDELSQPV